LSFLKAVRVTTNPRRAIIGKRSLRIRLVLLFKH
jgi:hypothetical protein